MNNNPFRKSVEEEKIKKQLDKLAAPIVGTLSCGCLVFLVPVLVVLGMIIIAAITS